MGRGGEDHRQRYPELIVPTVGLALGTRESAAQPLFDRALARRK